MKRLIVIWLVLIMLIGGIMAVNALNASSTSKSISTEPKFSTEPGPIIGDMLIPDDINRSNRYCQSPPGYYDTSEYMIGDVIVGIILMESNGTIDTSTEDWTSTEEANVVNEIQAGLNWWTTTEPNATLTFTYDINYGVPTSYEPITRNSVSGGSHWLWINEATDYLGYQNDSLTGVRDYINAIRIANNKDWAFAIFVVDSSADADGQFADGCFAYAYIGGPFLVMTYDNSNYGIQNMDYLTAHETGHIFYATDEYYYGAAQYSGYLNVSDNQGAVCLMNTMNPSGLAYTPLCNASREQVGWRDTDGDGILDIVDNIPDSSLNAYSPDPTNNNTPTYTGNASEVPYPNNNPWPSCPGNNVSINTITNVQYRVDGGSWINATASDGAFDEYSENFTFTTTTLLDGTHTIEVRATNSVGNVETTYATDTLTIITNMLPVIQSYTPTFDPMINETESITFNITAYDPDNDILTINWYLNNSLVVTGNSYTFVANYTSAGWYNVKVVVSDGELSVNRTWLLTVVNMNRVPVIDSYYPTTDPTITEEQNKTFNITASDPDNEALTISWYLNVAFVATGTSYTFTPNYTSAGIYEVKVIVSDGEASVNRTWTLTVINVNRKPNLINQLPDKSFDEDHSLTAFNLNDYFSDPDEENLDYTVSGNNHILVVISDGGTVDFQASADWYGNETITFRATDPYNAWVETPIVVTVNPVNDAPVISGLSDQPLMEDVAFWYDITLYINDVDNDLSDLIVSTNSSYITVHNGNHTLEMTYPNGVVVDYVRVTIFDGVLSDYEDIVFTITPVNNAPTISGVPTQYATEDIDLYLDVSPYVNDVDNSTDELTVCTNSSYVTVNGFILTFQYPNSILSENVRITVSDGINTSHQDIMIIVTPVNDVPVINSFTPTSNPIIDEGEQQVFTVSASDVDNTELAITWYLDGNTVATGNIYTYTAADYTSAGTYTIKVVVSDGSLTDEKTWILTVNNVEKKEPKGFIPGFEAMALITGIGICLLLLKRKNNHDIG